MASSILQTRTGKSLATNTLGADFSSVLSRTIESVQGDPAQLRNCIYELARIKLQREALLRQPPVDILEMRRLMLALETAIERVETVSSQRDALPLLQSLNRLLEERDPDIWVDTPTSPSPVQVIIMRRSRPATIIASDRS